MKFPWFDLFLAVGFAFLGGMMFGFFLNTPGVAGYAYLVLAVLDVLCAHLNSKDVKKYLTWWFEERARAKQQGGSFKA